MAPPGRHVSRDNVQRATFPGARLIENVVREDNRTQCLEKNVRKHILPLT